MNAAERDELRRRKIAGDLRATAERDEALAAYYEEAYADARPGSALAAVAVNARARAAAYRLQADHVEAGTWLDYLDSIGRGVRWPA